MSTHYKDYGYHTSECSSGEAGIRLADKLIGSIQKYPDVTSILDLGCGNGYIASRLASLGYNVTGVDASESGIELAQKQNSLDNLEFVCAYISTDLPTILAGKTYDLILSSNVIEHMYHPGDLIETATSLLRPGGHLVVDTPYHGYLKNLLLALLNKWDSHHRVDWDGGHIKFFSIKTLRELLVKYGYQDISYTFYGRVYPFSKSMIFHSRKPQVR